MEQMERLCWVAMRVTQLGRFRWKLAASVRGPERERSSPERLVQRHPAWERWARPLRPMAAWRVE